MCLRKKGGNDKHLIGFLCTNKLTTTTEGGKGEKNPKDSGERSQKLRIINVFLESLLSESFPLLGVIVHLTFLGGPPTLSCPDLCTCSGGTQILILSYSCVFLPPVSAAFRASAFSFVGTLNVLLYSP